MLRKPWRFAGLVLAGVMMSSAIASCSPTASTADNNEVKLTLVSYAVTQTAYENIIPQFAKYWYEKTGQTVTFDESYGGSGSQTRAVIDGLEADVVALALALDTQEIAAAGLIEPGWEKEFPNDSIVHKSVAAIVKRDPNLAISTWSDLAQNNLKVITANPKTSGGARWNFLVLWGAMTKAGKSETAALNFVETIYKNVPVLPKNARESSDVFYKQGQGDVLINYENEVILAQQQGEQQSYIIPTDYNISIDNPIAIVDANVDKHGNREVAEAFVEFLYTPAAQREFAEAGFRPVDPQISEEFSSQYPKIKNLFTAADLGGWEKIQSQFFDDNAVFDKIMTKAGKQ
ncbi:MAG: sulfate ABC transporter substrate-binding protein [Jaaginema sp. PMC 1079.18]|nr:sulfate ABC transporter substrate-binding protein [Jaaginema sp. PMC 1080.18]MEC4852745.1 sulfate ABC transporter substrate-binding protein [Jaaginema sp. PMC 1079.18]MEC4867931.1 sulfate ABC transporter substrate-binding protein [Jaaginema sp. PMC 1078.18]